MSYKMSNKNFNPTKNKFVSVAEAILGVLFEVATIHIKAFFPHPYYHTFCNHKSKNAFNTSIYRLKKRGLITIDKKNQNLCLTKKGNTQAMSANFYLKSLIFTRSQNKKEKWDGRWRIIIFDIPEKLRNLRDGLRSLISEIGFVEFQKSVWIYPYKVPDFIIESLNDTKIKKYARFLLVNEIDYDNDLKRKFFKNKKEQEAVR